jgi:hypothetical protein
MPAPVLPEAAKHMSGTALSKLRDDLNYLKFETFWILQYEGEVDGQFVTGRFTETAPDRWTESGGFTYQELSETNDRVVLYDASRDRTVTIDWDTFDLTVMNDGVTQVFDIIDQNALLWVR